MLFVSHLGSLFDDVWVGAECFCIIFKVVLYIFVKECYWLAFPLLLSLNSKFLLCVIDFKLVTFNSRCELHSKLKSVGATGRKSRAEAWNREGSLSHISQSE